MAVAHAQITAQPVLGAEEVFREHLPFVWRVLQHLGVGQHELEDAAQDVFVVVVRRLQDFEGRSALRTWLYGIAVRVAADRRKKRGRDRADCWSAQESALSERGDGPAHVEQMQAQREQQRLVQDTLELLDEDKRHLLILVELEELSVPEAAEILGLPLNTAYSRLRRARVAFSRLLERTNR